MATTDIVNQSDFKYAVKLMQSERFRQASKTLEQLLQDSPDSVLLMHNLAICHSQTGDYDIATERFEKVIDMAPDFVNAYINFGKMECLQGNYEEGLALFEGACKLDAQNLNAKLARAMGYHSCGRIADAMHEFEQIICEQDAPEPAVHFYISCLVQLQHFAQALKVIDELEAKGSMSPELTEVKAMCLEHLDFDQNITNLSE